MDIHITCVIGVSVYPDDGDDKSTIIQNASSAMLEAKGRGENFILYNKKLHEKAVERMSLQSDLLRAFDRNQFELHYQPIVECNGRIIGAEALIRLRHPERGLVPPLDFIPLAEETGIIVSKGKWTLYTACKQLEKWSSNYDIYVSINLSAKEFASENLVEVIQGALQNAGNLDPKRLKLEITETKCMEDPEAAIMTMLMLQERGIELFIDDFGTGQSSLSYLKRLPAKTLKIDKVFIDDVVQSPEEREYLTNILSTVKRKNKSVIIEGVSSKDQVGLLKKMKCDMMQGYYFSKPVRAEEFKQYLENGGFLPR
ncbi:putative signaling protein [subsurface metagenome]